MGLEGSLFLVAGVDEEGGLGREGEGASVTMAEGVGLGVVMKAETPVGVGVPESLELVVLLKSLPSLLPSP